MTYQEKLRRLVEVLRGELEILDGGDIASLERTAAAKQSAIAAVAAYPAGPRDEESQALIEEGAALCEQAALRVNLLLAGVERRLNALAAASGHGRQLRYGRNGRMAASYHGIDLHAG
jgi:hypothetical protein